MSYDAEQRRVIRALRRGARRNGATRAETISAFMTGLTESSLRNLDHGDGTSVNWRQETSGSYGNVNRMDLRASVDRYYTEAKGHRGEGLKPGQLAQAVQRSAFPDRYRQHRDEAKALYRGLGPTSGAVRGEAATRLPTQGTETTDWNGLLVDALLGHKNILGAVLHGSDAYTTTTPGKGVKIAGTVGSGGKSYNLGKGPGKLVGKPSDRAGVPTHPKVLSFAKKVASVFGKPITLGTGTNHNQMTTSGNVSDHWSGNALDLPATGSQLTRMGQAALIAAGMSPAKARKAKGGIYNVGGHQIIFNTTEGGNHWNHLHISAP